MQLIRAVAADNESGKGHLEGEEKVDGSLKRLAGPARGERRDKFIQVPEHGTTRNMDVAIGKVTLT